MADIGQASVPSQNLGIANEKNSVLQGSKQEFSNLSRKTQESDHQYNRRDDRRFVPRRSSRDMRDKTRYPQIRDRDKIHSLRRAMVMYLAGVPVFSIMLIGRWSSTAFLRYIRKQIQEFLQGISSKMIEVQSFKHVQNPTETNPMENIVGDSFSLLMG